MTALLALAIALAGGLPAAAISAHNQAAMEAPAAAAADDDYLALVERADSAMVADDWLLAERLLARSADLTADEPAVLPLVLSNLGLARFHLGLDSLALATLDRAHALAPRAVTVLHNRARVALAMGRTDKAYSDFANVMALDSTLTEPIYYHGVIALSINDLPTATDDFERLSAIDPEAERSHWALALLYAATDRELDMLHEYDWLITNCPSAKYYAQRASWMLSHDLLSEASQDIASAIALDPDDPELYLLRAVLNKKRYRPADARRDADEAIRLGLDPQTIKDSGL